MMKIGEWVRTRLFGWESDPVITFVIAPDIPPSEVQALQKLWNSGSMVVTNYEVCVESVVIPSGHRLLVTAPGLPFKETKKLRVHIDRALADPHYHIVLNYDVDVSTTPL